MKYHLTTKSGNAKTGPIPVSTSPRQHCADDCPLKDGPCYADNGPLALHWRAVSEGRRGVEWPDFLGYIRALKAGALWRHNQAGDLRGDGRVIDYDSARELAQANIGRRGFTYTHYSPLLVENQRALRDMLDLGFVVNLSANNLTQADDYASLGVGPVVTLLPIDAPRKTMTPAGRTVVTCPATYRDDTSCATCALCAVPDRKVIVGFPAHGSGAKKAQRVFFARVEVSHAN